MIEKKKIKKPVVEATTSKAITSKVVNTTTVTSILEHVSTSSYTIYDGNNTEEDEDSNPYDDEDEDSNKLK